MPKIKLPLKLPTQLATCNVTFVKHENVVRIIQGSLINALDYDNKDPKLATFGKHKMMLNSTNIAKYTQLFLQFVLSTAL